MRGHRLSGGRWAEAALPSRGQPPPTRRDPTDWRAPLPSVWLRSDLLAGVTVAAYFVPQVMAVTVGYLAGVALIMIVGQLGAVTGVPVAGRAFPAQAASFAERTGCSSPCPPRSRPAVGR